MMRRQIAARSMKLVHFAGVLALSAALIAALGCNRDTVANQVSDDSDNTVTMELRDDHVNSEDSIFVTYGQTEGKASKVNLGTSLTLEKDGRALYLLYWHEGSPGSYAKVEDVKDETADAVSVGGPYRFDLPPLEPGAYRVCNGYSIIRPGAEEADHGEVCTDLIVES